MVAAVLLLGAWLAAPADAIAGRRRVVVLELEGPKADKFHEGVVKAIKKSHTVVPLEKWTTTAEELDASKPTAKNIKKVAKKLKIDVVVEGKIDKRRDEYLIKLKLRSGSTGEVVGNSFETKAEGPRIDASAARDIKDEMVEQISDLAANRGGGDDEEDEDEEEPAPPPKKKPAKVEEAEEDEEEARPKKKGFSRDAEEDEEEEDEDPLPRAAKKPAKASDDEDEDEDDERPKKKVARGGDDEDEDEDDDDDEGIEEEADDDDVTRAASLTPAERAVDAVLGVSFNARRLSWNVDGDLGNKPPPYKGVPVAGALLDVTVFPGAIGHKRRGIVKNFGATLMFDKVLKINSKAGDPPVTLPTSQSRWAIGAVFRYPIGKVTLAAMVRYGKQSFSIEGAMGVMPGIPSVSYTILDPMLSAKIQASPKVIVNANLGYMAISNVGQMQATDQYGEATVTGFEGELGLDYLLTTNLFARAAFRFQTIGFSFKGGATQTNMRDADNAQDVFGARDNYLGGAVTVGYLY